MTTDIININAEIFRLFSIMFYDPRETFLKEPEIVKLLGELLVTVDPSFNDSAKELIAGLAEVEETELVLDYSALFIGPYQLQAPPYGSVYLDKSKRLNDESSEEVANVYRQFGLDVDSSMKEPADHIAIELEFMHTALIMLDNSEESEKLGLILTEFETMYLKPFATQMCDLMVKNASTTLYRSVGKLLGRWLAKA